MEESEKYLTYQDYRSMGGTLDLMPFNLLDFEAERKIDERADGVFTERQIQQGRRRKHQIHRKRHRPHLQHRGTR